MMVVIKTTLSEMPEHCEECMWYGCYPHPNKGFTDICQLLQHCMDADDQPEEWIYGGDGRPEACPLIEVNDENQMHLS